MKRVLITGAAGFTGKYVGKLLAEQGYETHGLVHGRHDGSVPGYAQLHEADLRDIEAVRRISQQLRPDHVVHLAAIAFVAHSDVDQMYSVNVVGTRHLLEALAELPRKPESILLASSANVYGNAHDGVLDEEVQPAPANDYGVTKIAMEYVASIYRSRLPLIVVRPFNYTGRGQSPNFVVPKIIAHVRDRAPVIELGDLEVARDFSDVRMIADTYVKLLACTGAVGQTLNVCAGRAISLRDILELAASLSGHRLEVRVNPEFIRSNEVRSLRGSPRNIETVIGPLNSIPFEETLRWMLNE